MYLPAAYADQIDIQAQQLDVDNNAHKAVFTGEVIVTKEALVLTADKVIVFYTEDEAAANEIEKIHAQGDVKVTKEARVATAQSAIYNLNEEEITFFEDVRVREEGKQNTLRGAKAFYDISKDKISVSGSGVTAGRVRGTFESKPKKTAPEQVKSPKDAVSGVKNIVKDLPLAHGAENNAKNKIEGEIEEGVEEKIKDGAKNATDVKPLHKTMPLEPVAVQTQAKTTAVKEAAKKNIEEHVEKSVPAGMLTKGAENTVNEGALKEKLQETRQEQPNAATDAVKEAAKKELIEKQTVEKEPIDITIEAAKNFTKEVSKEVIKQTTKSNTQE